MLYKTGYQILKNYLCISILEFKYSFMAWYESKGLNLCISILEFKFINY